MKNETLHLAPMEACLLYDCLLLGIASGGIKSPESLEAALGAKRKLDNLESVKAGIKTAQKTVKK